jgi:uncharacterized protein YecE (DUF72 family)
MKRRGVWIGTSGWVYKHWAANFYPKGWPKKREFEFYTQHFPTVEINATFYRLPTLKMVRGWRERSPRDFIFAVKGSRYLTHIRRLRDTSKGLRKYFSRIKPLAGRTGPILWQLPPSFSKKDENVQRLERFLAKLPREYQHAVEFRHPSWMDEQTHALLRRHHVASVWLSSLRMPADYSITADFVYLRFHGLAGGAYHDYTDAELRPWAKQLARAARKGVPCYVYFNNDLNTRAPLNAHALMKLLGKHAVAAKAPAEHGPMAEIEAPEKGPETWPSWTRPKTFAAAKRGIRKISRRPQSSRRSLRSRDGSPSRPRTPRRGVPTLPSPASPPRRAARTPARAQELPSASVHRRAL